MTNEHETDILDKRHTVSKTRVCDVLYTLPGHGSHHENFPIVHVNEKTHEKYL